MNLRPVETTEGRRCRSNLESAGSGLLTKMCISFSQTSASCSEHRVFVNVYYFQPLWNCRHFCCVESSQLQLLFWSVTGFMEKGLLTRLYTRCRCRSRVQTVCRLTWERVLDTKCTTVLLPRGIRPPLLACGIATVLRKRCRMKRCELLLK